MFAAIAAWIHGRKLAFVGIFVTAAIAWHEIDKRRHANRRVRQTRNEIENDLRDQAETRREKLREAEDDIAEQLDNGELRKLTTSDPNNRARMR